MNKKQQLVLEQQQLANEKKRLALEELKSLQRDFAAVASNGIKFFLDPIGLSAAKDDYDLIGLYIKSIEASGFSQSTVTALNNMKTSFDSAAAFHSRMSQDWTERLFGSLSPSKKVAERYRGYAQKVDKALRLL